MVSQQELDAIVDDHASLKKITLKVTVGVFFALSILSVVARVAIRLKTLRRLSLDDYLLFMAATALTVTTGLLLHSCDRIYLSAALQKDPALAFLISSELLMDLLNHATQQFHTFLILAWTAIFFVKFSFLAFFRQLIWKTRVQRYYWAVVGITIVSYLFFVAEPFILCSEFGIKALSCFSPSKNILYISLTGVVTGLDATTDLMIVSIPIIILYQAKIRTRQKVALGMFLCLSLVMVCIAITRASKIKGAQGIDIPWEFFWQFMEATIAVLMGSLTVFRTLLAFQTNKNSEERKGAAGPSPKSRALFSFHERMRRWREKRAQHSDEESLSDLPQIPSATMSGMRTFIRRNNRDEGLETSAGTVRVLSQNDTLAEKFDASSHHRVAVTPNKQDDHRVDSRQGNGVSWPLPSSGYVLISTEIRQEQLTTERDELHSSHMTSLAGSTVQGDWESTYRESGQPGSVYRDSRQYTYNPQMSR
ncbi:hypothetical protein QC761_701590 [Podospora bellae-mahoneyi]|uniref:Rhodopsin domain-containing protein n=1 Tax=Podospora bellae-mahoneyi TaxID=2093777 RepID=A0ABR0F801_9PEZI|nr:hypothetical protein QC761_701590 [Podospora bellae-mahoneyi]